jgi:hypothetical protein
VVSFLASDRPSPAAVARHLVSFYRDSDRYGAECQVTSSAKKLVFVNPTPRQYYSTSGGVRQLAQERLERKDGTA